MKKKPKIFIVVEDGIVQDVISDTAEIEVEILDYDNAIASPDENEYTQLIEKVDELNNQVKERKMFRV